ncbi:MAG: hypothetical protein ACYTG6_05070 [Planctomycetota bacterium]|jgi:hypothetical protein
MNASAAPGPSPRTRTILRGIAVLAAAVFVLGLFVEPTRIWPNFLVAVLLLTGLGLAGVLFLALHYVTGARWSTGIRRIPEAMTGALLPAGLLMVAILFGAVTLYPWADEGVVWGDAGGHGDEILQARSGWMDLPFAFGRAALCFGLWIWLATLMVRNSRRQDRDGDPGHRTQNTRLSALFLVVFGVTFSVFCFDWLMSVERHWFSTMFAVYVFSGVLVCGLGVVALLTIVLRRRGTLGTAASDDVLHDLGKLIFGFSLFWGYIWFCQFMLIWYANNPEETGFYIVRHGGAWAPLAIANVALNWAIPFVILMPRKAKRNERVLLQAAVILILGRWLDLFLLIMPATAGGSPVFMAWDIWLPLGALSVFALVWWRAMGRAPPVPLADPATVVEVQHHGA